MRLLVVEDDRLLNNTLCYNLSVSGYAVDSAMTMAEAVRFFETPVSYTHLRAHET